LLSTMFETFCHKNFMKMFNERIENSMSKMDFNGKTIKLFLELF